MKALSCLFILTHVYVHICNLSGISINKLSFISTYCVKYTKAFFAKFFEFSFVEACMLKLSEWSM